MSALIDRSSAPRHLVTIEATDGRRLPAARRRLDAAQRRWLDANGFDAKPGSAILLADAHGKPGAEKEVVEGPCFITFGRTVVNLNDPALTRYLSLEVTIQADGPDEEDVKTALESRKPILQTWLTSHLADKTLEDIRGKVGVNRLRREIQDNFNALLFTDGRERIQDILFEEFHVQ